MEFQRDCPIVQDLPGVFGSIDTPSTAQGIGSKNNLYEIVPRSPPTPTRAGPLPLGVKMEGGTIDYAHTSCQVEVFSVRIDQFDKLERRRGELYGSVEVVDILGCFRLFDRPREYPQHIRANQTIDLTGSPRCIAIISGFSVNLDLCLRNDNDDEEDVVVGKWQLSWDVHRPQSTYITRGKFLSEFCSQPVEFATQQDICESSLVEYDKPVTAVFSEKNGCVVSMEYAIFEYAIQTYVEVEIVHLAAEKDIVSYDIHGSLVAVYTSNDGDQFKIPLLVIEGLRSPVKAKRWTKIQLSRCMMAVPAYSDLIIDADLWDGSYDTRRSIAKGSAKFRPYEDEFALDYITGDDQLGVRLLLDWNYEPKETNSTIYTL